ncbi:MAG TPA: hypothetical protein VE224_13950 [Pseudolabrys sp.]|nr:hypothetical protein [Pseudolabrys sp.]
MSERGVTIVKLGGSLAGSSRLAGWLDRLAACKGAVVVVPGGGPFADTVRRAQTGMGFDDSVAHHLALLAMEQFGRALVNGRPRFVMASTAEAIRAALVAGLMPVWAPAEMALAAADIPASWDVTSDSLAAWLAGRLGAERLLLVKHGHFAAARLQVTDLIRQGLVDAAMPRYLGASRIPAFIVGADDAGITGDAIGQGSVIGALVALHDAAVQRLETS